MSVLLVSDAHLTAADDPAQAALVVWLDRASCAQLVVLGDLFHHWWSFPDGVLEAYRPVCDALERLVRRGTRLAYLPGNHDFRLGPFFTETLAAELLAPQVVDLAGVRTLLGHGDEADESLGYAWTRWVLRGDAFDRLIRRLGPMRGTRLLARLAGVSRDHGEDAVAPFLEAQRRWAVPRMAEGGARLAVVGHLHAPAIVSVEGGFVVHLGDWERRRCFLEIGEDAVRHWRASDDGAEWQEVIGAIPRDALLR
jgi:UDP-2,3-diacylglucosamine hydrolase